MTFRFEAGNWRISSLNVGTRMAVAAAETGQGGQVAQAGDPPRPVPLPPIRPAEAVPQ